jgi:hypothetical protein
VIYLFPKRTPRVTDVQAVVCHHCPPSFQLSDSFVDFPQDATGIVGLRLLNATYPIKTNWSSSSLVISFEWYSEVLPASATVLCWHGEAHENPYSRAKNPPSSCAIFSLWLATDRVYTQRVGEVYYTLFNKNPEWHWLSNQTREEVFITIIYDSKARDHTRCWSPLRR